MLKVRWFLLGVIATLITSDWLRLRAERKAWAEQVERAVQISEARGIQVTECLSLLEKSKNLLDTTQVAWTVRVKTGEELEKKMEADDQRRALARVKAKPEE